ncbi:MAG: 1-deoxy-D-xylulose-5-phosphate reductoisomerase [Desulfobacteraceae bacterium 4572_19]|nr:MAG: 1-deoxy-D-xylulose-5-phosphate reductoisomerase [Desulfobacteraceae bacterium 4572_19]
MKALSILGATGSIGCNVLNVVEMHQDIFSIKALAGGRNIDLLAKQILKFNPEIAVVIDKEHAFELEKKIPNSYSVEVLYGLEGYIQAASLLSVDIVVSAMVGAAGLLPTLSAIDAGKTIALANKETLVMAGEIVMERAKANSVDILPIDSEHSAIFQCLSGQRYKDVSKILLTASGGPFRTKSFKDFGQITLNDALAHPNWEMGNKISIDSSTMMNKGFEVIEAMHLFNISPDKIEVVVHPQSIIHSMVAYIDGSVIAQMGVPNMKGAISYALSYPERLEIKQPCPDFTEIGNLTFEKPDLEKFPCLSFAFKACQTGHTLPAVLNAANEVVVDAFLNNKISFLEIHKIIKKTMDTHQIVKNPTCADILAADKWARIVTGEKM